MKARGSAESHLLFNHLRVEGIADIATAQSKNNASGIKPPLLKERGGSSPAPFDGFIGGVLLKGQPVVDA